MTLLQELAGYLGVCIAFEATLLTVMLSVALVEDLVGRRRLTRRERTFIAFLLAAFVGSATDRFLLGSTLSSSMTTLDMSAVGLRMDVGARAVIAAALFGLIYVCYQARGRTGTGRNGRRTV